MPEFQKYPCPCCKSLTYPLPSQNDVGYICGVCWWENDPFIQSANEPSDQNRGLTLRQARENYAHRGISDPQLVQDWIEGRIKPWAELVRLMCRRATRFQIHCWHEERDELVLALRWGQLIPYPWDYGSVVEGDVTPEFVEFLASLPEPPDKELYDKRTPFFTIHLNNDYRIEHYGTEFYF